MKYLIISILILFTACSTGGYDQHLLAIEDAIEERPDSVLPILETTDRATLNTSSRALHGYLLSRARHKCFIDEINDSIISFSIEEFRRQTDYEHLMKALYLKGHINYNSQNYTEASISLLEAEEYALEKHDFFYLARIYELFSNIYQISYNNDKSLEYESRAVECFNRCGKTRERIYATIGKGIILFNSGDFIASEALIDSLLPSIDQIDSVYRAYALLNLAKAQLHQNKYSDAESNMERFDSLKVSLSFEDESLLRFGLALSKNNISQCHLILDSLCSKYSGTPPSIHVLEAKYELLRTEGKLSEATVLGDSVTKLQHDELRMAMSHPLTNIRADYLQQKKRTGEQKNGQDETCDLPVHSYHNIPVISIILFYTEDKIQREYHQYQGQKNKNTFFILKNHRRDHQGEGGFHHHEKQLSF